MRRLREFDFIRATAALSVIAIHTTGIYVYTSRAGYLWNQGMRYAVPLFMILSGLLLFYSDQAKSTAKTGYLDFVKRRLQKIVIPYVLWTLIYVAFNNRHGFASIAADVPAFLLKLAKDLLWGSGALHLYFVILIIQMYLLYPVLKHLVRRWPGLTLGVSFLVTLACQSDIYFSSTKNFSFLPRIGVPFYMTFMAWIFFFVLGMTAVGRIEGWTGKSVRSAVIITGAWVASFVILMADSIFTRSNEISSKPSVILYCITSFLFFYIAAVKFKNTTSRAGRFLDWFSAQSFMIYLGHILVLDTLVLLSGKFRIEQLWTGKTGMVLFFLAVTAGTSIMVYIVSLTPLAGWLGAVPARKAPGTGAGVEQPKSPGSLGA